MALKPDGGQITIKEQIIDDLASGLTLQFEKAPDGEGVLRIFGDLPFGNRSLAFTVDGQLTGAGTHLTGSCPSWLQPVD